MHGCRLDGCRLDCYRPEDSLDSGISTDNSTLHRPPVPWSGNPADRGRLNHIRRPDQQFQTPDGVPQFQTLGSVPPTSTVSRPRYFSDSETEYVTAEGQWFGWGGQRPRGHQAPMCLSDERLVQEWTERNIAGTNYPQDYHTLGARRHRQMYNGAMPAISAGVTADNPITANMNRYTTCFIDRSLS